MDYIAFLRGINVGGKNIIKMADLKLLFVNLEMNDVITYIQSGNVLFSSDKDEKILIEELEKAIEETFSISVPVIIRNSSQLEQILKNKPFSDIETVNKRITTESFYIFLFAQELSLKDAERISVYKKENDKIELVGRDLYVLFDQSIRNSKLANTLQKMKIPVTSRNMNTIAKLFDIRKQKN